MFLYDIKNLGHRSGFAHSRIVHVPWRNTKEICPTCYEPSHRERTGPYTIEWQPGSSVVPDFPSCLGGDSLLLTDRVKQAFEQAGLTGYVAWPVPIREPKRSPKRSKVPRVPSPYPGPPIWDIYVTEYVHIIPEQSKLEFAGLCPRCKRPRYYALPGPAETQHFVIDRRTWNGCDFMRPHELNTLLLTPRVIEILRPHDFTNYQIFQRAELGDRDPRYANLPPGAPPPEWLQTMAPAPDIGQTDEDEEEPLSSLDISYPHLKDDSARSSPVPMSQILEYLTMEADDDTLRADDLHFIRTARVGPRDYWIWRFEEQDGSEAFVTVSRDPDGSTCVGYDTNDDDLTPEQFIYGTEHDYF